MIQKNLFLLEYMVKKRIEKDTERLEAIRSISGLLSEANIDIDNFNETEEASLIKKLMKIKGRSLSKEEFELVEEIFTITKNG